MTGRLTPTEDLILDVLAARWRLGERLWTFDSRLSTQIEDLAGRGLVTSMHGVVEKTVRASLTEAGRALVLDDGYQPPKPPTASEVAAAAADGQPADPVTCDALAIVLDVEASRAEPDRRPGLEYGAALLRSVAIKVRKAAAQRAADTIWTEAQ